MADMYRCCDCGKIFKAEDSRTVSDLVGEYMGSPAYEYWDACPECVSTDLEEYRPAEYEVRFFIKTIATETVTINSLADNAIDEIEAQLKAQYGDDYCGYIDAYGTDEVDIEQEG